MCEVIYRPAEFVSQKPHWVVDKLDWVVTRYLCVQTEEMPVTGGGKGKCSGTGVSTTPAAASDQTQQQQQQQPPQGVFPVVRRLKSPIRDLTLAQNFGQRSQIFVHGAGLVRGS